MSKSRLDSALDTAKLFHVLLDRSKNELTNTQEDLVQGDITPEQAVERIGAQAEAHRINVGNVVLLSKEIIERRKVLHGSHNKV